MKTEDEIKNKIVKLNHKRSRLVNRYMLLCHLDKFSAIGNEVKMQYNYILGKIDALHYVLRK